MIPFREAPLLLVGVLLLPSCGGQSPPAVDTLVEVGGHRLHIHCFGSGTPVVVVDVGLGDRAESWKSVLDPISSEARVCVYDRAGYPGSDPGPIPRHSQQIADELHSALHGIEVGGPYVLVGHSIGGLNVQAFAARYRFETAGIVLLDPPPLSWILGEGYPDLREMAWRMTEEWEEEASRLKEQTGSEAQVRAVFLETLASEHREMFGASAHQIGSIESFGNLPMLVLGSGQANPNFGEVAEEYQRFWAGESLALSRKSTEGEFILIEESSHNLYADVPARVVQGILRTHARAKRSGISGERRGN